MGNNFVIYLAGLVPNVEVGESEVSDKKGGIYQLDIVVKNTGFLPTATEQAQALRIDKPVLLEVLTDENLEIIYGEKKIKLGQIKGYSESPKTTYILRVKNPAQQAVLTVHVTSQKAGRVTKDIPINE
jgi:hypothetical protein